MGTTGWYLIFKLNWSVVDFNRNPATNERNSKVCHYIHNIHQCEIIWDAEILWDISWDRGPASLHYDRWKWVNMAYFEKYIHIAHICHRNPTRKYLVCFFCKLFKRQRNYTSGKLTQRKKRSVWTEEEAKQTDDNLRIHYIRI